MKHTDNYSTWQNQDEVTIKEFKKGYGRNKTKAKYPNNI